MVPADREAEFGLDAPFTVANRQMDDAASLRSAMRAEGYLFFRGLIAPEPRCAARSAILSCCAEAGWLSPGSPVDEAIAAPGVARVEPEPEFMAVYNRVQRSEAFHALAHDPNLLAIFDRLFGETALPHPRNIARIIFPRNTDYTTPSHQDYIHVQGTEETYTAWIPLGACPRSLGSLAVLEGSHNGGILPVRKALGAGGMQTETGEMPCRWVGSDFAAGDVVIFHSLTVHRALPNLSGDRLRLSVDFRYQPLSHPISASSLLPHHGQVTWEQVYEGWQSDRLKYYWQDLPIRHAESDPRVHAVRSAASELPGT